MRLKISFSDFWNGFVPEESIFWLMLQDDYDLELVPEGELHFFSSYGNAHLGQRGRKVFFSAENETPPRIACDFAITQRERNSEREFFLPLFLVYHFLRQRGAGLPLRPPAKADWMARADVCSVISNQASAARQRVLTALSSRLSVAHGGKVMNNTGGPVPDKEPFIRGYRFHLALENSIAGGYITEKIYDAFMGGCVPIYWGTRRVSEYFNPRAFLFVPEVSPEQGLDRISAAVADPAGSYRMVEEPIFADGFDPDQWLARLRQELLRNAAAALSADKAHHTRLRRILSRVEYKYGVTRYYGQQMLGRTFR
jgi:hypothetical protein